MKTNDAAMVARTILAQLGGNKFLAMTGAKNLTHAEDGLGRLAFKLPRKAKDGINYVAIRLETNDTYTVIFSSITGLNVREVSEIEMAYAQDLQRLFTEATGLDTKM
jgi:hypothetical protein